MAFAGNERFQLRRELGRGGMGIVFEAFDHERRQPVAIKMLHHSDGETIFRLKREFRSLSEIAHPRLISMYELLCHEGDWFFTMELIQDGRTFVEYLNPSAAPSVVDESSATVDLGTIEAQLHFASRVSADRPAAPRRISVDDLARVLEAFRQLAQGVDALHSQRKLHRDLKPANVLVRADGSVVILDFGLVIHALNQPKRLVEGERISLSDNSSSSGSDDSFAGTVHYMAPEQASGLPLTEASDWYAFGAMLFEALSGQLPFDGVPIEIMRGKLQREAPPLATLVDGIPPALASLCTALLRRDPALRPRAAEILTALGAGADLPAAPAAPDQPPFVGRDQHLGQLRTALEQSRLAPVIAHLHGRSGSGKSALMRHFLDSLATQERVLIFRGRCYEQESVPYKSIDGLADGLALWLAQCPESEQRTLLPPDAHAFARIFPILRRVPAILEAVEKAAVTRDLADLRVKAFHALGELLRRIGERYRLVLCIDDLQWGDAEGLEMLGVALRRPAVHLLLLVTYRDEAVHTSPSLAALRRMEEQHPGLTVADLPVEPLSRDESIALIRALLPEASAADFDAIVRQAGGNPFFVQELARHRNTAQSSVSELDEILWSRISGLPEAERELLETIAVSGQPIRLVYARESSGLAGLPPQVLTSLRMHHFVRSNGTGLRDEVETYHDRIRETVLAHMPGERRTARHASLAFCLEASGEATSDTLAVHFESGAQPAKAGHFYELAARESAQALAFARAEEFYRKAAALSPDLAARTRIAECLVHLYTDLARFPEAYAAGREALLVLSLNIPARFHPPSFALDLLRNRMLMRNRAIASILDLPAATDERHIARTRLLAALGKAAFQIRPELCIQVLLKLVNACIVSGNTQDCAIGYMAVGAIFFGGILRRYQTGYEYGQIALKLVERYSAERIRAEVHFVVGYFGISWRRPAREAEDLWEVAQSAGLSTGDLFHLGCASCAAVMSKFMRGAPLDQVAASAAGALAVLERFHLQEPRSAVLAIRSTVEFLCDPEAATRSPEPSPANFGSRHLAHYAVLLQLQREYLAGDYTAAMQTAKRSEAYLADSRGMLHSTEHFLYASLARLALLHSRKVASRALPLAQIHRTVRCFQRWALGAPENFGAKAILLRAEWLSAAGRDTEAVAEFSRSVETGLRYNQAHIAGLASHLKASVEGRLGRQAAQRNSTREAAHHYTRWGAVTLVHSSREGQVVPHSRGMPA